MTDASVHGTLPYKLACLCDLRDARGRVLLLRRKKAPNQGLCSPIGGKLDMTIGESPAACAQREILEEAGIHVPMERLHLGGLISEAGFEGKGHWLLFYFRVLGAVEIPEREFNEGWLEWHEPEAIDGLALPETDRRIIWPLIREHEVREREVRAHEAGEQEVRRWSEPAGLSRPGDAEAALDASPDAPGRNAGVASANNSAEATPGGVVVPGFFSVHIDCTGPAIRWEVHERIPAGIRHAGTGEGVDG